MPVPKTFSVYSPFSKYEDQEDGTLMVWGRATQEIGDSAGETMDYATSAPFFQRRSQENSERSGGQNLMPLRAMHQSIAAGRVLQFDYLDVDKAIDICSHVVDPVEISKVKNHVYTGFSVGGKYIRRWQDGGTVRYTADPREISLVDAPAVPTAKLTLFKADVPDDVETLNEEPAWVEEFRKSVVEAKDLQKQKQDEQALLLKNLESVGERVGIAHREGSPLSAPMAQVENVFEYGDPANFAYPISKELWKSSVDRFNADLDEGYQPRERHILGRRLSMLVKNFGGDYNYDPALQKLHEEVNQTMTTDFSKLDPGTIVASLKAAAGQSAALGSTDPRAALASLLGAIDSLPTGIPISAAAQTLPVNDPSTVLKADVPEFVEAKTKAKAKPSASDEPVEEESESDDADPVEVYKRDLAETNTKVDALAQGVNDLLEMLAKRVTAPVSVEADANSPVSGLNSIVEKTSANGKLSTLNEVEQEIIKCFDEGGPYSMLKALQIAGANDDLTGGALAYQTVNNAVRKASYESLEAGGVITSSRYSSRLLG